jgi:hypothetical protein
MVAKFPLISNNSAVNVMFESVIKRVLNVWIDLMFDIFLVFLAINYDAIYNAFFILQNIF